MPQSVTDQSEASNRTSGLFGVLLLDPSLDNTPFCSAAEPWYGSRPILSRIEGHGQVHLERLKLKSLIDQYMVRKKATPAVSYSSKMGVLYK